MLSLEPILQHVPVFLAAMFRMLGLFIVSPGLGGGTIPTRIKILLALALTIVVYPTINLEANVPFRFDLIALAPICATEILIGFTVGMIASMPMMAVQMGGLIMGQQMGLGLANFYNPAIDTEGDIIGQILFYVAIGMFLSLGGFDILVFSVVASFDRVAIGGMLLSQTPLDLMVGVVHSGFELAIRVAMPVLCVLFLETVAVGFIMKTVPQLNILSFGFPIRILAGVSVVYMSLSFLSETIAADVRTATDRALGWVSTLGPPGGGGAGDSVPPLADPFVVPSSRGGFDG
ncbi:MAG: flagellar biosynthetic protein FliR [Phycisphaerales bacterium]